MRLFHYLTFLFLCGSLPAEEVAGEQRRFTEDLISGKTVEYALYGERPIVRIPNATGDEMLRLAKSGGFPHDDAFTHTSFICGSYFQNCRAYYIAYRVTGDSRFVEQLRQYARLMSWILRERPHLI